jgi:hypothetical protein
VRRDAPSFRRVRKIENFNRADKIFRLGASWRRCTIGEEPSESHSASLEITLGEVLSVCLWLCASRGIGAKHRRPASENECTRSRHGEEGYNLEA